MMGSLWRVILLIIGLHPAVGRIAYGISSYKWAGLDGQTGDPQGYLDGVVTKDYAGIFKDSVDNQIFHGSSVPLYSGFLGNSVRWKSLSLSANITYRLVFISGNLRLVIGVSLMETIYMLTIRIVGKNQVMKRKRLFSMIYPIPAAVSRRDEFYANSEIHVKKGDNIRLQDVRLSYDLPKEYIESAFD